MLDDNVIQSSSTDYLIAQALDPSIDNEDYLQIVWVLRERSTTEVFEKAKALCLHSNSDHRVLGIQIVCLFGKGRSHRVREATKILLTVLHSEQESDVLTSVGWGLGHLMAKSGVLPLVKLKNHPDANVRCAVTGGLVGQSAKAAIQALIELSNDADTKVRSWATFGLGSMTTSDTPEIREALESRLNDVDDEVCFEAMVGLAARKDQRALKPLLKILEAKDLGYSDLEAAKNLAAPELLPSLIALRELDLEDKDMLEEAIVSCQSSL